MSSTISVVALLLVAASAGAAPVVSGAAAPLPQAVLAHPAAETNPSGQALLHPWSPEAYAAWGGPWLLRPGLYDHRYITW
jgi:hypothetical protein